MGAIFTAGGDIALLSKGYQIGSSMVVAISSAVAEHIDKKSSSILRKFFFGDDLFVMDGASYKIPFSVFPFAGGLGKVNPGFGEFSLPLVTGMNRVGFRHYFRLLQPGQ